MKSLLSFLGLITAFVFTASHADAENWNRFRGPNGTGISELTGLPVEWNESDYDWKVEIPGLGHSSPCTWENMIFVSSSLDDGTKRLALAYDADTGKQLWQNEVVFETNDKHALNSFASATPTTDGKHVAFLFAGSEQTLLIGYDLAGKEVWRTDFGPFVCQHGHGCGTSPITYKDLAILSIQHSGPSFVAGVELATGKIRWKNERETRLTGHCTPTLIGADSDAPQVIYTNTDDGIASLDPRNGDLIWRAKVFTARAVNSPVVGEGFAFAICGGGGRGKYIGAIPVHQKGELTFEDAAWSLDQNLPYVLTPLIVGENMYLWGDNGVLLCVKVKTGEVVYLERIGGIFSASPVCIDGKIYCASRDGEVVVVATGDNFQVLARNQLGEGCHATPAISGDRMILRGFKHLFALKAK